MRSIALLLIALSASASASADLLSSLAAGAGNPTSLFQSVNSLADGELKTLSEMAATASGQLGAELTSEYLSLKTEEASAQRAESSLLRYDHHHGLNGHPKHTAGMGTTTTSVSGSASAAATGTSGNFAPATAMPIAAGAVGMVVLAMM